ncbi:MAG: choice-of-anchor D domain-containing protein, partial [Casimicrobiaceae bacterium]
MRCSVLRLFRLSAALACAAAAFAVHADPALPWPGFLGEPAQQLSERNPDGSLKHLYIFGAPYAWKKPVVWNYNDAGRPDTLTSQMVIDGIDAAAHKWMDVCSIDIHRGADSTSTPQDMAGSQSSPLENVIGFGDLTLGPNGNPNVAGITWSYGGASSSITEFDMTMSTDYVTSPSQLARVAVHEWGHALGLAHSNLPGAVMSGPDNQNNPGVPDTQYNLLTALTDDDKHGCLCLYGPSAATAGQGYLCGLPSVVAMGTVRLGKTSIAHTVYMTNKSPTASLKIAAVILGSPELVKAQGCTNGTTLGPGEGCSFSLSYRPIGAAGLRATSYVQVITFNGNGSYAFPITASAVAGDAVEPVPASAQLTPTALDFGAVQVGTISELATATISNTGAGTVAISSITPTDAAAAVFDRSGSCVPGMQIYSGQSCALQFRFAPATAGSQSGHIEIATSTGTRQLLLTGAGVSGVGQTSTVVEYYNATLDHYFMTATAGDIDALDRGLLAGW